MTTGFKNNNPGNINYYGTKWQGATGKTVKTADGQNNIEFQNMAYGLRAMLVILNNYLKQGIENIHDIVIRWVGKDSPDVIKESQYIAKTYFDNKAIEDDYLTNKTDDLVKLAKGIIKYEIGNDSNLITNEQWQQAILIRVMIMQ